MHVTRHTPIDNPVRDGGSGVNRRPHGATDWGWSGDVSGRTAESKTPRGRKKKHKTLYGIKYEPSVVVDLRGGWWWRRRPSKRVECEINLLNKKKKTVCSVGREIKYL